MAIPVPPHRQTGPDNPDALGPHQPLQRRTRVQRQMHLGQRQQRLPPGLQQTDIVHHQMGHPVPAHHDRNAADRHRPLRQGFGQPRVDTRLDLDHRPDRQAELLAHQTIAAPDRAKDQHQQHQPPRNTRSMRLALAAVSRGHGCNGRRQTLVTGIRCSGHILPAVCRSHCRPFAVSGS